jgi:transmembrane protein EpsG
MDNTWSLFFYFFMAIITVGCTSLSITLDNKNHRIIFRCLAVLIPSIVAGIRYNVGTDYMMYQAGFNAIVTNNTIRSYVDFELGYIFINKIVSLLGGNFYWLMFIMQLATMHYIYKALLNEKDNIDIELGMFIYMFLYYLISFNLVRQGLALSISIYAITCLNKKNKAVFIFYVLLASLFHKSALICLGILAVKFIFENRNRRLMKRITFIFILFCVIEREMIGNFVYFIYKESYYASYFTRQTEVSGNILGYFVKNIPFIAYGFFTLKAISDNKQYSLYYNLMTCGYILSLLGYFTETQVQRIAYYFTYLSILVLPFCAKSISNKYKVLFKISIIFLIISFWLFNFFYKGYSDVVPYKTIIDAR